MRRSRYHRQDPYWTVARFDSVCSCGTEIKEGDDIFFYSPYGNEKGQALCGDCGLKGDSDLQDEKINEQFHVR